MSDASSLELTRERVPISGRAVDVIIEVTSSEPDYSSASEEQVEEIKEN
jgi:hypothetical protein